MTDRWIVIPRWEEFQHYRDRDPVWIKNHRSLLNSEEYLRLTFVQRGILHGIWLEYAASNRQLRDSTVTLTRRLGQRVTRKSLDALNHAGFLRFSASKPLADRYHDASPEREEETETEEQTPEGPTLTENPSSSTPNEASYLEPEPHQRYDPIERPDFAAALQAGKRQGSDHHTNEDKPWWT